MKTLFRATDPAETGRVRQFLASVFGTGLDAPYLDPKLVRWKWYDPRPDWPGSRSYVIERAGEYLSHGCVWPMPFFHPDEEINACQIIDWAASAQSSGSGIMLRRKIEEIVPMSIGIGGSADTQRVMPLSGYSTLARFRRFVRVVRPVRQLVIRRDGALWKRVARGARAMLWSLPPLPTARDGWKAERVEQFQPEHFEDVLPVPAFYAAKRSAELLNYLLRCPSANMRGYLVRRGNRVRGHFLLSQVHGQTRFADFSVDSAVPDDWVSALLAATTEAAAWTSTCEIVANTSLDLLACALQRCGYRARGEQPVFVMDKRKRLAGKQLHIMPADYDDFFAWHAESHFAA